LTAQQRRGGGPSRIRQFLGLFAATFVLATAFTFLSDSVLRTTNIYLAVVVLVLIILVGIVFDIIGLAAATASHVTLNAMAAKRVPGAKHALRMVRNAPRVAAVCNDLVGDIAGTVSGAAGTAIVLSAGLGRLGSMVRSAGGTAAAPADGAAGGLWTVLVVALIAAVTVGGKTLGKSLALERADDIVFRVGRVLFWLEDKLGVVLLKDQSGPRPSRRKVGSP